MGKTGKIDCAYFPTTFVLIYLPISSVVVSRVGWNNSRLESVLWQSYQNRFLSSEQG